MRKMNLNIIYTPQPEGPVLTYDNNGDHIWMSNSYKEGMPNIAMNNYSAIKIKKNDSILLIEPMCVLTENYNINFLKQFKYIFTWATKVFENSEVANKTVYTNVPSYKHAPKIDTFNWLSWENRSNEIVFIANNKSSPHPSELYSLRTKLADWLHENSKFKVSWYGNIPLRKPYYKGSADNKAEILRKVKFHVCMENSYDPVYSNNFLSEKLSDAMISGTVPIYMGCSNLSELGISEECYINLLPFRSDFAQLELKMQNFSLENYLQMTQCYIKLSDELHRLTSYDNMFKIMLKTYSTS